MSAVKLTKEVVNVPPPKSAYPVNRPQTDLGGVAEVDLEPNNERDFNETDEETP
jgi:hypothetical protein